MTHPTLQAALTLAATMRQELTRNAPQTPEEFVVHTHVEGALTALEKRLAQAPVRMGRPRATTEAQRAQIRLLRHSGMSGPKIASEIGCSQDCVYRALKE
jgi:transposase